MMELFQEYDVEFVSSTEKFDTLDPDGTGYAEYLHCIAQLERETSRSVTTPTIPGAWKKVT